MNFCNGCSRACDGVCRACDGCCEPLKDCTHRPLGGYVLFTCLLAGGAGLSAAMGLADEEVRACRHAPIFMICGADAVLSVVHVGFAFYVQRRLIRGIRASLTSSHGAASPRGSYDGSSSSGESDGEASTASDLMKNAAEIVRWDVGFCLYVFVFFGSWVFNAYMAGSAKACGYVSWPAWATWLMNMFGFYGLLYAVFWYCALSCDSTVGGRVFGFGRERPKRAQAVQQAYYQQPTTAKEAPATAGGYWPQPAAKYAQPQVGNGGLAGAFGWGRR